MSSIRQKKTTVITIFSLVTLLRQTRNVKTVENVKKTILLKKKQKRKNHLLIDVIVLYSLATKVMVGSMKIAKK